jgi:hypothetical protein
MTPEEIAQLVKDSIAEAVKPLTEQIESLKSELAEAQSGDEPDLAALAEMTDEELTAQGLDPAQVDEAIAAHNAEVEAAGDPTTDGEPVTAGADAGAAPAAAATGLEANVISQLTQFAAELRQAKAKRDTAENEQALADIETRFDALLEQNAHLQEQLATGGTAASHGAGTVSFTAKTGVKIDFGTKDLGAFEEQVIAHIEANPKDSQAKAFSTVIKTDPVAYQDYKVRKGVIRG